MSSVSHSSGSVEKATDWLAERFDNSVQKYELDESNIEKLEDLERHWEVAKTIKAKITQLVIDTDVFFVPEENYETADRLNAIGIENNICELKSIYGHDGFLIEFDQLEELLKDIF